MKIIFMGTPDFAVPSLKALHENGFPVSAVVTTPDRPAGRGLKMIPSPVKAAAVELGIPVLQPEKLRDPGFQQVLQEIAPDLAVVVAFRMLPKEVWGLPRIGTFNLHASLLPDYRGAAPINWAVINGETETGITTFFLDEKIDTGPLLIQTRISIPDHWCAGDLHDALMEQGAALVLETVKQIAANAVTPVPQNISLARHNAPKIFRDDCRIQWNKPRAAVRNLIRGLSPYPAAWTQLNGMTMKIYEAELANPDEALKSPGSLLAGKKELFCACADGWLKLTQLQMEGKKRMTADEFLRGTKEELIQFM